MSCLFVHDFRSYSFNDEVYSTNLSYDILKQRYVSCFGELNIINRYKVVETQPKGLVKSSGDFVNFVGAINQFQSVDFFLKYNEYKKIIINEIEKNDYVIIRLDSFLGLIAAEYCYKNHKKYLIEVVGCVWDSFWNKGFVGKILALPLFCLTKRQIARAPFAVYVTSKFLQSRYPNTHCTTNISNVELSKLNCDILTNRIEHINSINEDYQFSIVTVASVEVRYKGQESVIRALALLNRLGIRNYKYYLIGGGNPRYLVDLANRLGVSSQVVFVGSLTHTKVLEFLDSCDIYIQPSKQEGLPRALIEGMSRGLFCIGTRVAGIPELLEKDYLISKKHSNYKEIAEILTNLKREVLVEQATVNFNEAKKYEKTVLDQRRTDFFNGFKEIK